VWAKLLVSKAAVVLNAMSYAPRPKNAKGKTTIALETANVSLWEAAILLKIAAAPTTSS
jgi:hypothetical protein